jgi:hypothetical protein
MMMLCSEGTLDDSICFCTMNLTALNYMKCISKRRRVEEHNTNSNS